MNVYINCVFRKLQLFLKTFQNRILWLIFFVNLNLSFLNKLLKLPWKFLRWQKDKKHKILEKFKFFQENPCKTILKDMSLFTEFDLPVGFRDKSNFFEMPVHELCFSFFDSIKLVNGVENPFILEITINIFIKIKYMENFIFF